MSKKQEIRAHYEPRISPGRDHYKILDWATRESQRVRFRVLADNVNLTGRTLLDVGCGLGDLWTFLKGRGVAADYTGVDLLESMISLAGGLHPDVRFVCADVFAERASKGSPGDPSDGPPAGGPFAPGGFDVVFCSGAFNLNLGNKDEFLPRAVARLFELAREYVVFNLLHVRSACDDPKYAWYDPADVRGAVRPFAADCRILDDYLPNDFTVICRKADLYG